MATRNAPIDPVERDLVSAQLDELAVAHDGQPWQRWKNAVVEWHMRSVAVMRADTWVPGLAGAQDPAVEKVLDRFYRYHMRAAIGRLRDENVELRRKLIDALECARFYAGGGDDGGERATALLNALTTRASSETPPRGRALAGSRSH